MRYLQVAREQSCDDAYPDRPADIARQVEQASGMGVHPLLQGGKVGCLASVIKNRQSALG
jgi:hypothetical protein